MYPSKINIVNNKKKEKVITIGEMFVRNLNANMTRPKEAEKKHKYTVKYKRKTITVYANTEYEAQKKASKIFGVKIYEMLFHEGK